MANTRLRYNGLKAFLGASLTNSGTSITFSAALTHSNGTAVPTIAGSDYIPLAILDPDDGDLLEIVYLTAYTTGTTGGTITRGQEGTAGIVHASGEIVINGPTVADLTFPWTSLSIGSGFTIPGGFVNEYCRTAEVAYLNLACAKASIATTDTMCTLPAGFRPKKLLPWVGSFGGVIRTGFVATDGTVKSDVATTGGAIAVIHIPLMS